MPKIHLTNSLTEIMTIVVEPIADRYSVAPGQSVALEYDASDLDLEIDIHGDGDVQVWTHGPTTALSGGKPLEKLP